MSRPAFVYHGTAMGLGGTLFNVMASAALPATGGCADAKMGPFPGGDYHAGHGYDAELGRIVSFQSASANVWGGRTRKGAYRTVAKARLEGMRVLEGMLSWKVVSIGATAERPEPAVQSLIEISPEELCFEGLTLFGYPLEVEFNDLVLTGVKSMDDLQQKEAEAGGQGRLGVWNCKPPDDDYLIYSVIRRISWKDKSSVPEALQTKYDSQTLFQGNRIHVPDRADFYFGEVYRSRRSVRVCGWRGELRYPGGFGHGGAAARDEGTGVGPEVGVNGIGPGDD